MSEHDDNQQNEEETTAHLTNGHSTNALVPSRSSVKQLKDGARQLKSAVARRATGTHAFAGRRLRVNRILMRKRHRQRFMLSHNMTPR